METAALNNLWNYISNLPLSEGNRQWLADRLLEHDKPQQKSYARELRESLVEYTDLKENWDCEGAEPICKEVIKNVSDILDAADEQTLKHWILFPATNGTLTFQHEKQDTIISIGIADYSFLFYKGEELVKTGERLPIDTRAILQIMKKTNKINDGEDK